MQVVDVASVGLNNLLVHDAHADDPGVAFALSRLSDPVRLNNTAIGVFREVRRASYDTLMSEQIDSEIAKKGAGDLAALLAGNDTWAID